MIRKRPHFVGRSASAIRSTSCSRVRRYRISCSMEMISSWCCRARAKSPSRSARLPDSSRISQSTPAGGSPASRAKSTAASVWPALRSTPPSLVTSGKRWPGRTKSVGTLAGSRIVAIAVARSAAVIPVRAVRWSTGTVNAVPRGVEFDSTIIGSSSRLATSGRIGMQTCPRPSRIMKFTICVVA